MTIRATFAANVRKYRKAAGLTQEALAEKTGLHRTYIGGVEQQRINPSIEKVAAIADALGIDPAFLFFQHSEQAFPLPAASNKPSEDTNAHNTEGTSTIDEMLYYALCTCSNEGLSIQPLDTTNPNLSIHILCSLIEQGFTGENLIAEFNKTQTELLAYFNATLPK